MDVVLSVPGFAVFAAIAFALMVVVRKTRLFWVPSVALVAYGVTVFLAWPWTDAIGGQAAGGAFDGLSNLLHIVVSGFIVVAGVVSLLFAMRFRVLRRDRKSL